MDVRHASKGARDLRWLPACAVWTKGIHSKLDGGIEKAGIRLGRRQHSPYCRHAVTPAEAEEVVSGASLPLRDTMSGAGEERHAELGTTARGRLLIVAWTWRRRKVRVVTAFPANRNGAHFGAG